MTREERLELLKQIEKDIYVPSIESTFLEDAKSCAIHSVIAELEQEPCEDCISRQAVIEVIEDDNRNGNYSCFASNNDAECFKDVIRSLSSVTPKPKADVLDKIRAEIQEVYHDRPHTYNHSQRTELFCEVMKIIDKYKAESEEK